MSKTKKSVRIEKCNDDMGQSAFTKAEYYYSIQDYEKAFEWYKRDIESQKPNPVSFFNLGYAYEHGEGVECDPEQAVSFYKKAAGLGLPQAMYNLAFFYQNGIGVLRNQTLADEYSKKATSALNKMADDLYREKQKVEQLEQERLSYNAVMNEIGKLENGNAELGKALAKYDMEMKDICRLVVKDYESLKEKNGQLLDRANELKKERDEVKEENSFITRQCDRLRQEKENQIVALDAADQMIRDQRSEISEIKAKLVNAYELNKIQEEEISTLKQRKPVLKKKTILLYGEIFATLLFISRMMVFITQETDFLGNRMSWGVLLTLLLCSAVCGIASSIFVMRNKRKMFCIFNIMNVLLVLIFIIYYILQVSSFRYIQRHYIYFVGDILFYAVLISLFLWNLLIAYRKDTFCDLE